MSRTKKLALVTLAALLAASGVAAAAGSAPPSTMQAHEWVCC